jgi:hypothetical protein
MTETFFFCIDEEEARRVFGGNIGSPIGQTGFLRVAACRGDTVFELLRQYDQKERATGLDRLASGWDYERLYTANEILDAELVRMRVRADDYIDAASDNEVYDYSIACPYCGEGRKQISELRIDTRKLPKKRHVTCTIAGEWLVSEPLVRSLLDSGFTGFGFHPIIHKADYKSDRILDNDYVAGSELIARAAKAGYSPWDANYLSWTNRPENRELLLRIYQEHCDVMEARKARSARKDPIWFQLCAISSRVLTCPPTKYGITPFDENVEASNECPLGHVSGRRILTEIAIRREDWDQSDLVATTNLIGFRSGYFVPEPMLLISPRLWRFMVDNKVRGVAFEVAHLV